MNRVKEFLFLFLAEFRRKPQKNEQITTTENKAK